MDGWVVTPYTLKWEELNKTIKIPNKTRFFRKTNYKDQKLLSGLNGIVESGKMLAIMGPTGCGKTTLLNILSGRLEADNKSSVTYNNNIIDDNIKSKIGYVLQEDIFYQDLTVKQILTFTAKLHSKSNVKERVKKMINELGLIKCQNTIIGNYMVRGVSGGERKRTNIANELLNYPSVLFLDEPTSGLDSSMSFKVMSIVKNLTKHGISVIVSIHQPSSQIFSLFDDLLLLYNGKTAYYGRSNSVGTYLSSLGYKCPPEYSLCDFMLDLLNDETIAEILINNWEYDSINNDEHTSISYEKKSTSWFWKTRVLLERHFLRQKSKIVDKVAIIQMILIAVIIGLFWLRTEHELDKFSAILFVATQAGSFNPLLFSMPVFPSQFQILTKERASKLYPLSSFVISQMIIDIPFRMLYPTLFVIITYWMIGFTPSGSAFIIFLLIILAGGFSFTGLAYFTSSFFTEIPIAITISTSLTLIWMICCGYFLKLDHIPVFMRWIQWTSPLKYEFEALIKNEFDQGHYYYYFNILILIGFGILFRILAYIVLHKRFS